MTEVKFWQPALSYQAHKEEFDAEMQRVLSNGDLILRKDGETFEESFAKFQGRKYAVGVASGTDALILSMKALGIGQGDEVITSSYTFRATVEAIHHVGATPVLADLGEDWSTYATTRTAAIIPAHLEGEVVTWHSEEIPVIDDACQAVSAKMGGIASCYSFYPAKILGCFGDGGAVTTDDESLYNELKALRNHYKGDWSKYAYNSRLDNLQAAVLNVKLKYLPEVLFRRKEIARMYDAELMNCGLPPQREVYQDYVIVHPARDVLRAYLSVQGVETMANEYPFPAELRKGPMARKYEKNTLRIPCNENLTDEEVAYVIETINSFV